MPRRKLDPKGFYEQAYKKTLNVAMRFAGGMKDTHIDAIKGLNEGHAMYRAKQNWPTAEKIVKVSGKAARKAAG